MFGPRVSSDWYVKIPHVGFWSTKRNSQDWFVCKIQWCFIIHHCYSISWRKLKAHHFITTLFVLSCVFPKTITSEKTHEKGRGIRPLLGCLCPDFSFDWSFDPRKKNSWETDFPSFVPTQEVHMVSPNARTRTHNDQPGTKSLASREIEIFGCQGLGLEFLKKKAMDKLSSFIKDPLPGCPGVHHKDRMLHWLHGKNRAPKDWKVYKVKSLGDGFGFLLFFRVVSGDYGKPWYPKQPYLGGGNSTIFFYFHPGSLVKNDPIWRAYFSKGLVQPPPIRYFYGSFNWMMNQTLGFMILSTNRPWSNWAFFGFLTVRNPQTPSKSGEKFSGRAIPYLRHTGSNSPDSIPMILTHRIHVWYIYLHLP